MTARPPTDAAPAAAAGAPLAEPQEAPRKALFPAAHLCVTNPPTLAAPPGYSHVVEARGARTVYVAGQVALDAEGRLVGAGDVAAQPRQVFENLRLALAAAGADFRHVVKLTTYVVDAPGALPAYRAARDAVVAQPPPASTLVEVRRLVRDEFLLEVEAVAVPPD